MGGEEWECDEVGVSNFSQIACRVVMFPEEEGLCVTSRNYIKHDFGYTDRSAIGPKIEKKKCK